MSDEIDAATHAEKALAEGEICNDPNCELFLNHEHHEQEVIDGL